MAAPQDNSVFTYGDVSRREDVVLNAIEYLTATEDSIQNVLPKSQAVDVVHSYLTDTLDTAASAAVEQGVDFTIRQGTTPTRLTNLVQEVAKAFRVTRPQEAVQHYHGQDETQRQTMKALKDWGNSFEFDLVRGTRASGASGTAQKMDGIIRAISKSTNYTLFSSVAFNATILDSLMQNNMDNSNGDVATDLYVGGVMKRAMDAMVQKTNNLVAVGDIARIVKTVRVYESSFGVLNIHYHRYVKQAGDLNQRILAIRPDKLAIAYLDKPFIKDLPSSGAYTAKAVYGSATLEVRNQDSNWFADGFQPIF